VNQPIAAVLFDWGDTLIRYPGSTTDRAGHVACVETLYRWIVAEHLLQPTDRERLTWSVFLAAYDDVTAEQFRVSRETHREHRLDDRLRGTLRTCGYHGADNDKVVERMTAQFVEILVARSTPMPGVKDVLGWLVNKIPLGVVSNHCAAAVVERSLERAGLVEHLSSIVISGSFGWIKPDPRPFAEAARQLGVSLSDVLYVGNEFTSDVMGGKSAGCRVAWLAPDDAPSHQVEKANIRLSRLHDLLSLPGLNRGDASIASRCNAFN